MHHQTLIAHTDSRTGKCRGTTQQTVGKNFYLFRKAERGSARDSGCMVAFVLLLLIIIPIIALIVMSILRMASWCEGYVTNELMVNGSTDGYHY